MEKQPNRIRELRLARGWSAEELAQKAGTFQSTISRLEGSRQAVTIEWLVRLALALGVRAADLLPDENAVWFARVVGDLRRVNHREVMLESKETYLIPTPLRATKINTNLPFEAFQTGDQSWLIGEKRLPYTLGDIGKPFVVFATMSVDLRTYETSDRGGAFFKADAPQDRRWIPMSTSAASRIVQTWRIIAEFREL